MPSSGPDPASAIPPAPPPLEDRLRGLEATVLRLEARLSALERGGGALPTAPPSLQEPATEVEEASEAPSPATPSGGGFMDLGGIASLVLGGAFFIRALTDSGKVPQLLGIAFGLLYACIWLFRADRAPARSRSLLFSLLFLGIVHPLLWESTTTFRALSPGASAAILAAAAFLLMAVAWRRAHTAIAWIVTLASLVLGLALLFATKAVHAYTAALLVFGAGSLWLAQKGRWTELRWPVAIFADWAVLVMAVFITSPNGLPEGFPPPAPLPGLLLCLALVHLYLVPFVARILRGDGPIGVFEIVQTLGVLPVGLGGATQVARTMGRGSEPLGLGAIGAALTCYALSVLRSNQIPGRRSSFIYLTTLAVLLMLSGGSLALPSPALAFTFAGIGILGAFLGIRYDREILVAHSAAYLFAAGTVSGALGGSLGAFAGAAAPALPPMGAQACLILAMTAATYLFLVLKADRHGQRWFHRVPAFALGTLAILGAGALVTAVGASLLGPAAADPGHLATLRTGILAFTAVLLAWVARRFPSTELGWLVRPVLLLGALKLALEDLPKGRPLTLFLAFTLFGAALWVAPRMMRSKQEPTSGTD